MAPWVYCLGEQTLKLIPIYPDKNATDNDFSGLSVDQLYVSSVFSTLQGEGTFSGCRAVFVRLSGCNYGSKGTGGAYGCEFCDADFRLDNLIPWNIDSLIDRILFQHPGPFDSKGRKLVVITGGEPMMQPSITRFISHGLEKDPSLFFQIESNGYPPKYDLKWDHKQVWLTVSPKIPQSLDEDRRYKYPRIPERVFARINDLKVLVDANPESPYHNLPNYLQLFLDQNYKHPRNVYLSPINVYKNQPLTLTTGIWDQNVFDHQACSANHKYAAQLCVKHGYKLSVQQHVYCGVE